MRDKQLQQHLASLRSKLNGQSEAVIQELDELLQQIFEIGDPDCIEPLLLMLRDDTEPNQFIWSTIHTIEAFEPDDYARHLLSALPDLNRQAPELAKTLHFRILNSEPYRSLYTRILKHSDSTTQQAAKDVLSRVMQSAPEFEERVTAILRAI